MESEESRDAGGDASSSSSGSSSGSRRRSRSSSSEQSQSYRPRPQSPRSPSPPQETPRSPAHSTSHVSEVHSDINSPEDSPSASPSSRSRGPSSPAPPKSPDGLSTSIRHGSQSPPLSPPTGPKTPQSPTNVIRSAPASPEAPASPDSRSEMVSPRPPSQRPRSPSPVASPTSASPDRAKSPQSPPSRSSRVDWSPKADWARRKTDHQTRARSGSDSSRSSRDSSYNKRSTAKDPATEEISDGEMESDHEDAKSLGKLDLKKKPEPKEDGHLNISHEDLSDVSDLDSMGADDDIEKCDKAKSPPPRNSHEIKLNGKHSKSPSYENSINSSEPIKLDKVAQEKTSKAEDGEEQLDFEAEEGECVEAPAGTVAAPDRDSSVQNSHKEDDAKSVGEASNASSLEEGEVSDEGERRPEESEPRPVCRFYSRGQCTWGISCRFLHPGVTDKGNYSMFEVIRGVASHAPPAMLAPRADPTPPESAWERGLRTAKEMLRQANKRKEQDLDFEEKKLHLSVGGAVHDPDAELAYAAAAVGASPPHPHDYPDLPPPHAAHLQHRVPPHHLYSRGGYGVPPFRRQYPPGRPDERDPYERVPFERPQYERPYERLQYEDPKLRYEDHKPRFEERATPTEEGAHHKRRVRASREVIVQRSAREAPTRESTREAAREATREATRDTAREAAVREAAMREAGAREAGARRGEPAGAGDEWADPWMRESAASRRRRPPSSHSSYSTSSSSRSSSRSSRSAGSRRAKRRPSPSRQRLSPSVIVRERRLATARATAMNPPAPRRRAPSPAAARQHAANPPAPPQPPTRKDGVDQFGRRKQSSRGGRKRYSHSSTSGSESSSSSSGSDSETHSSTSSGSSSAARRVRTRTVRALNAANRPRLTGKPAGLGPGTMAAAANKKDVQTDHKESAANKKRSATSPAADPSPAKKSVSRREELLKQLKAVEDAIARKRSKI